MKNDCIKSLAVAVAAISLPVFGLLPQNGNLTIVLSDIDGNPITNATVTVESKKLVLWGRGCDDEYNYTSANSDSNGVASVDFQFYFPDFEWELKTPSHYSRRYNTPHECFRAEIEESDYVHIDTNTTAGAARERELKGILEGVEAGDESSLTNYIAKLEPKSVTYTDTSIRRSLSFYPKRNPQPMYAYGGGRMDLELPRNSRVISSNGVDYVKYDDVEFDLKEGLFLPPWGGRRGGKAGLVSDFKVVRYSVATNGVTERFGWIEFAPGCGAYKRKKTGDDSFPSVYEADTNAVFLSRIQYRSYRRDGAPHGETVEKLLPEDEYMVLRTRVMKDEDTGSITNCHYSKIIGRMYFDNKINFEQSVFNPRPNDPNLEYDSDRNLAR